MSWVTVDKTKRVTVEVRDENDGGFTLVASEGFVDDDSANAAMRLVRDTLKYYEHNGKLINLEVE